ncbi:MAG: potassium channel family protein [Bacillota bacterium]
MAQLVLLTATGGLLVTIFWLGRDRADLLLHTLLRPALLAMMALLLLVIALDADALWPYGLVAAACFVGLWESYSGVYQLLAAPAAPRTTAVEQVRICAAWMINVLSNLVLLNFAAYLAFPSTYQWRDQPASLLDVAYFTMLTFASGGYGDVLPATALGKLLAMLTSICGLTYATILFAALFQRLRAD